MPAPSPPPRHRSLKRASEEKEQRLALVEDGRAAADREVMELRATLRELERARLDARRELQELRRQVRRRRRMMVGTLSPRSPPSPCLLLGQVKDLDSENNKRSKEVGELQARVALEEQREEESRREAFGLRQKVVESEAGTEAARKEVGRSPRYLLSPKHPHRPIISILHPWVSLLLRCLMPHPWVPPSPRCSVPCVPIALPPCTPAVPCSGPCILIVPLLCAWRPCMSPGVPVTPPLSPLHPWGGPSSP